jgi:hypothetical protein
MISAQSFFTQASHSPFSIFYPTHYIVAIFRSYVVAQDALDALRAEGYQEESLMLSGNEFISFSDEIHQHASLWGQLVSRFSRIIGSEELLLDIDLQNARLGGTFLAIHSPNSATTKQIREIVEPFWPVSMHHYSPLAVERII